MLWLNLNSKQSLFNKDCKRVYFIAEGVISAEIKMSFFVLSHLRYFE